MDEATNVDIAARQSITLCSLPNESLLHIFSYLNYKDLCSCCQVSKRFNELCSDDSHWKRHCVSHWKFAECAENLTWKDQFVMKYNDVGQYIDCYPAVLKAWKQIESYMKQHCPEIYESLNEGTSETELNKSETAIGHQLPAAFRCVYRIHDGQKSMGSYGLFGGLRNYDFKRSGIMLPLSTILLKWNQEKQGVHSGDRLLPLLLNNKLLMHSPYVTEYLIVGSEKVFRLDPGTIIFPSGSYRDFFISGKSYLDWFTSFAQELENGRFVREDENILRFHHDPTSVAVTKHVRITVATAFVHEHSQVSPKPSRFVHAYRVTMSMEKEALEMYSCQLETRHWEITDETGKVERVDGPGVIGEYPIMKPGVEWSYISCTHFETVSGSMRGTFTMRNLATGIKFEAEVPVFRMTAPEYVTCPMH